MSTYRLMPQSPPHHRDPHRASTGNLYQNSYDGGSTFHSARSSTSTNPSHASSVIYEAQPVRKTIHPDGKRTEYIVRPRHNSMVTQGAQRPLTISTTRDASPPRRGSRLPASPRDTVSTVGSREDSSRLLSPSTALVPRPHVSHHQRHNSASRADQSSFDPYRHRKDRLYHVRESEAPKQYYAPRPKFVRQATDEDFSYTGPREQFARDYPIRPRRDSNARRERPSDDYDSDREYPGRRTYGPTSSPGRHLHDVERVAPARRGSKSGFDSDPDRPNETSRRHQSLRAPAILHQQYLKDEGYNSSRDDYDSRRISYKHEDDRRRHSRQHGDSVRESDRDRRKERERDDDYDRRRGYDHHGKEYPPRQQRSRETSPERSRLKELTTGAFGGVAAAGALKALTGRDNNDKGDVTEEDDKKHRRRHRRHRKLDDDRNEDPDEHRRSSKRDESSSESPEDKSRHRRRSRKREHDVNEDEVEQPSESQRPPRPRSVSRVRPVDDAHDRTDREHGRNHVYKDDYEHIEARTMSPGENEDDRPRKVMLVEPEKKEEVKPKGILKPARQVPFPEDPNPIREGVAPLKDAKKDGVPVNARWTKISRLLVNPEALEKANERFEERDDYVIVLRVVSKEEIQKLADKTAQIREIREREWEKRLQSRTLRLTNGRDSERTDSDEDDHRPLAIEAAPSAPPADLRSLSQRQESSYYQPQSMPIRSTSESAPVPDIHINEN